MVRLNRIYTKTGDAGETGLGDGERRPKSDIRIAAYGTVDETNAVIGIARLATASENPTVDAMLARIQNDLFDLGADLCVPDHPEKPPSWTPLRVSAAQVTRLENEIDEMNAALEPLRSFVLPGGSPGATHLHLARTVCRRAERLMVELMLTPGETISGPALQYINRLSDHLFVASRFLNLHGPGDVLWTPGANR